MSLLVPSFCSVQLRHVLRRFNCFNSRMRFHNIHTFPTRRGPTTAALATKHASHQSLNSNSSSTVPLPSPLSLLPFAVLLRSYLVSALSSSSLLLSSSLRLLSILANSQSVILSPDRNHALRYILKKTLYAHFCAGETTKEVRATLSGLKGLGYTGVILVYGKEVGLDRRKKDDGECKNLSPSAQLGLEKWKQGNLKTIGLVDEGDFVALKFSGAGRQIVNHLAKGLPPNDNLEAAMLEICELAKEKGVRLLVDSEQYHLQSSIDIWTLRYQMKYNRDLKGRALIYGTYQSYLQSCATILSQHLSTARDEGFVLGIKLVRGAYMGSDPRHVFWATKEDTDRTFDSIAEELIQKKYHKTLQPSHSAEIVEFPKINLVLATHNHESVRKALSIQKEQADTGHPQIEMAYGQLLGMADEVGCELIMTGAISKRSGISQTPATQDIKAYKYLPWGSVGECMKYLVRRAEENRDAVGRTKEDLLVLKSEIIRRLLKIRS